MKTLIPTLPLLALLHLTAAEAPQEHSHEKILLATQAQLELDNPLNITNAVFGLLGDGGAAGGAGGVTNIKCLQQATADQAFTNAKAAADVAGMAAALMYRALERNTAVLGNASELCDTAAVNPEVAALTQHQDPASPEAAAGANRKATLALATQLAAIGADPLLAIQTGTFPAGVVGDSTGDGFICDDSEDLVGCIFTTGLLVADVSAAEIQAHLGNKTVDTAAVVIAAAGSPQAEAQLLALADTVNATKKAADLQGESNAKGTIFTLGGALAAAHPNAADARKATAAAFEVAELPPVTAQDLCLSAVKQTVQGSNNAGGSAKLDEKTGVDACVAAQASSGAEAPSS